MVQLVYASVDRSGDWRLTGSFTTIDLIAAATGALNGALLARRPSHYRNYTIVGVLLVGLFGGITGSRNRDRPATRHEATHCEPGQAERRSRFPSVDTSELLGSH